MKDDKWGVGNQADSKSFRKVKVGEKTAELIHGEHPHSRQDNTTYARFSDGEIEEFSGHHYLVGFSYSPENYTKCSRYSGDEVRKGGQLYITVNEQVIYTEFCREPERAAQRFLELSPQLLEGPIDWSRDPESQLTDRKIFYKDTPAILYRWIKDQAAVMIRPEKGHKFPRPRWSYEDDYYDEEDSVKDDILSPHIYWYRN